LPLQSLKRRKLYETISEEVMSFIETQGFKQGDRLPAERFFCEQLQIGRSSFREAMKKLETYGLIEIRPGSGMYLKADKTLLAELSKLKPEVTMERQTILEIIDLREMMEQYAIERIIEQRNEPCILRLESIVEQYERTVDSGQIPRKEDHLFHLTLYEGAGNRLALQLFQSTKEMERLWSERAIEQLRHNVFSRSTEPLHREIFEALRKYDAKSAKRLLRKHFQLMREDLARLGD